MKRNYIVALIAAFTPWWLQAQETPLNPEVMIDEWSQVMYCQKAYEHPNNKSRVYEYDIKQCNAAAGKYESWVSRYDQATQDQLRAVADDKTRRIIAQTRDVTQVLGACRETCQKQAPKPSDSSAGQTIE